MAKTRILLIDDDSVFLEEAGVMLRQAGYETACMTDAQFSVGKVRHEKPDVILLDVKMGFKSGLQVAFEIQKDPVLKRTPIIAMSALYPDHDFMGMCGISEKLAKPFFPADVIDCIGKVLKKGGYGRA